MCDYVSGGQKYERFTNIVDEMNAEKARQKLKMMNKAAISARQGSKRNIATQSVGRQPLPGKN